MRTIDNEKNDVVNGILNYSKAMVDEIIVDKGVFYPDEFRVLLYLIYAGMISHYGVEEAQTICDTFTKIQFVYIKDNDYDVLSEVKNLSEKDKSIIRNRYIPAFCNTLVSWVELDDGTFEFQSMQYTVYAFSNDNRSLAVLLEMVTHEINHVVNSIKKPYDEINGFTRIGLQKTYVCDETTSAFVFEEAINELQTVDIINNILVFTNYDIDDSEVSNMLSLLKNETGGQKLEGLGYRDICPIIKPLYDNYELCEILRNGRLSGEFDEMIGKFDAVLDVEGAYDDLLQKSDELVGMYYNNTCFSENIRKLRVLDRAVKQYTKQRLNK